MKPLLLFLIVCLPVAVLAQPEPASVAGQRQPAQITILPLYQQYDIEGKHLSEFSTIVTAFVPVRRNLAFRLRAGQASAGGDVTSLSGLSDVQVSASYTRDIGPGNVLFSLGLNLPTGKQQLSLQEFETVVLLSSSRYSFQVPSFGQGWGAAPAVTYALPLSEAFVLGLGAAYQYRGAFEPQERMTEAYDPGNEVLITGGFDLRLGARATFAADVAYTLYRADRVGMQEVFEAGEKTVGTLQFRHRAGFNELWLLGRYRSRGKNSRLSSGALAPEQERTTPNEIELRGRYARRLRPGLELGLMGEALFFEERSVVPGSSLFGAGLAPRIGLSRSVWLSGQFLYYLGDITGLHAGVGITMRL